MRRTDPPRQLPRRLVLTGLVAGAGGALTGCGVDLAEVDLADLDPRSDPATPTATVELQEPSDPDRDADVATLEAAHAEALASAALLEAVARRHPRLRAAVGPVAQLHRRHAEALAGAAPDDPAGDVPPAQAPRRAAAALRVVQRTEQAAQDRFTDWAMEARSGRLARLLGSMSASVAQGRSTLPETVPTPGSDR